MGLVLPACSSHVRQTAYVLVRFCFTASGRELNTPVTLHFGAHGQPLHSDFSQGYVRAHRAYRWKYFSLCESSVFLVDRDLIVDHSLSTSNRNEMREAASWLQASQLAVETEASDLLGQVDDKLIEARAAVERERKAMQVGWIIIGLLVRFCRGNFVALPLDHLNRILRFVQRDKAWVYLNAVSLFPNSTSFLLLEREQRPWCKALSFESCYWRIWEVNRSLLIRLERRNDDGICEESAASCGRDSVPGFCWRRQYSRRRADVGVRGEGTLIQ